MEGNSTHHQLFISGVVALHNAGMIVLDFLENINDPYGIDSGHLTVDHDEGENIVVSPINIQLTQQQLIASLQQTINLLATSENCGIEIYQQALNCLI